MNGWSMKLVIFRQRLRDVSLAVQIILKKEF